MGQTIEEMLRRSRGRCTNKLSEEECIQTRRTSCAFLNFIIADLSTRRVFTAIASLPSTDSSLSLSAIAARMGCTGVEGLIPVTCENMFKRV